MTMRTLIGFGFGVLLLAAVPAIAADSDFNGRWDITTLTQPRPRAWWVELSGVGSTKAAGKFVSRATRLLESATPEAIGSEFSTGLKAQAASYPNNYLQNSGSVVDLTPGGGPPSIARGTQILEDYVANTGFGGQCALHVQPQTAPNLLGARRVGDLLLTVLDNVVIPDPGYNGNGPGNAVPAA